MSADQKAMMESDDEGEDAWRAHKLLDQHGRPLRRERVVMEAPGRPRWAARTYGEQWILGGVS